MEKFQEFRELANKKMQLADHILTMTYPMVKDSRLFLTVVENMFLALSYGMSSILHYEMLFKRVSLFPDDFRSKFELFKDVCRRYNIDKDYLMLLQETRDIIIQHKKSPVEFSRKDQFVICNGNYRMKPISANMLKGYISKAKSFISEANNIVSKNEKLFSR